MIYDFYDIIIVPFPFVDSSKQKPRPALLLSSQAFNVRNGHSIVAMITTATNTSWPDDIPIEDLETAGLPLPSVIRFKIFTLDNDIISKKIGQISSPQRAQITSTFEKIILPKPNQGH